MLSAIATTPASTSGTTCFFASRKAIVPRCLFKGLPVNGSCWAASVAEGQAPPLSKLRCGKPCLKLPYPRTVLSLMVPLCLWHLASVKKLLQTCHPWLQSVAELWAEGRDPSPSHPCQHSHLGDTLQSWSWSACRIFSRKAPHMTSLNSPE